MLNYGLNHNASGQSAQVAACARKGKAWEQFSIGLATVVQCDMDNGSPLILANKPVGRWHQEGKADCAHQSPTQQGRAGRGLAPTGGSGLCGLSVGSSLAAAKGLR